MGNDGKKFELERIGKYELRKSDFDAHDLDSVAALAALSYAVSEINVVLRLYLFIDHDFDGPPELDSINHVQRNVLLRILSAKIFEASEMVQLRGRYNRSNSVHLKSTLLPFQKSFKRLKRHPGYTLVQNLRNEATNHCTLNAARLNLSEIPDTSDFSFLLHSMDGNCLYLMGETVMHYGRVLRQSNEREAENPLGDSTEYDIWMSWNMATLRWLRRVHTRLAEKLTIDHFEGKLGRELTMWIPEGASAKPKSRLTPFFVRKDE